MADIYEAQRFSIKGNMLTAVFQNNAVASIVIRLYEEKGASGRTGFLIADVYSVDSAEKKIGYVNVDWGDWQKITLKNEYIERKVYITRAMYDQVLEGTEHGKPIKLTIDEMQFRPKPYPHPEKEPPGDYKKDFVGYKVKIKRKKKK